MDLLKAERVGKEVVEERDDEGSSTPRRHWPQKAVTAHAATAASKGNDRSSPSMSWTIILALIGGRGGREEVPGAELRTPFKT